ncbi:hypothetical protein DOM21_00265 [Bacteriovorax stolpii]|nr:hypothetical protein DOM21_00265 [Bacteriovorax stolpii]TDP54015.1 lecithin:cholesterol acyltransferase [Bacteriovorax stolpii]
MPRKILLFVPGYYGSMLKEERTGAVRWAKASNFLLSQKGLSQNIPGTKIGSFKKLVPAGILKNVVVVPRYWDVDSYGKTLSQLEIFTKENQIELATVDYDWRDDFVDCLKVIDQKIKSFNLQDSDELYVLCHSMGALLMSYYLRYGAQDVDHATENWEGLRHVKKAALIAPPLHGLMILFRDMETGTRLALNRKLLSNLDYSTFRSSYFFLPPKGEDVGMEKNGQRHSLGIHDIEKWQKNLWGPFKHARPDEQKAVREFVEKMMERSTKFHALLRAPVLVRPSVKIPLLHIRGLGHKTLEIATLYRSKDRLNYRFTKQGAVDGDGTVTAVSGASLAYFNVFDFNGIDSRLGHLDVLARPESQKIIQDFLKK